MLPVKFIIGSVAIGFVWALFPAPACQKSSQVLAGTGRPAFLSIDTALTKDSGLRMLALGDSYTIGEAVLAADRYPEQLVRKLREDAHIYFENPEIIATTGWTTANLLRALSAAKQAGRYDAVTLLIGVNNQYQGSSQAEYKAELDSLLRLSINLAGNRPSGVLVLSIPDYSVTPYGRGTTDPAGIASQIDSFNAINKQLCLDFKVNWLDVTAESRKAGGDPTLLAADGLHFSGKEYSIWAGLMAPVVRGMLR